MYNTDKYIYSPASYIKEEKLDAQLWMIGNGYTRREQIYNDRYLLWLAAIIITSLNHTDGLRFDD